MVTVTASDSTDSIEARFTVVVYDPPEIRTDTEMSGIVDSNAVTPVTAGSLTVIFPRRLHEQLRLLPGEN